MKLAHAVFPSRLALSGPAQALRLLSICIFACFANLLNPASGQSLFPGSLDTTFLKGAGADGFVRVVTVQPDGKILLGGNFSTVRGANEVLIARLNSDGSADPGFSSPFPLPVLASRIYTVAVQTNGYLVVGGLFTSIGTTTRTNIARLRPDGSLDSSFNSGAGPSGLVRILALQPDGKVILGGEFSSINNTGRNRIARLNADGTLDNTFDPGTGADNAVRSVALLPNGQILVGGLFTTFDGHPLKYLARLNSNGSLDTSYPAGSGPDNAVYFLAPQAEGTALVGGDFVSLDGTNISRIARLHADGSLDETFLPPGGASGGPVYHILRQVNGRILLGGAFTNVNGASLNRLARLNSDGSLDKEFNPGTGASDMILSMALQTDGRLLAGGLFATYNDTSVAMFARVNGDPVAPSITLQPSDATHVVLSWPAWAASYGVQSADAVEPANWQLTTNPVTLQANQFTMTLPISAGSQYFRLISQ